MFQYCNKEKEEEGEGEEEMEIYKQNILSKLQ